MYLLTILSKFEILTSFFIFPFPFQVNGLNYAQFLRHICVQIGSRIDDTSEFHSIFAFVRRCVGTYDEDDSEDSSQYGGNEYDEED